ncbi:MAG: protein kinase [Acidobacteria bacterium]|nr:protein kinase [Acidobacteriota bacterium]
MSDSSGAWSAGSLLGPYELIGPIGAGGMGEVWKARDTRLGRTVAIKRLKAEHAARFEQEARAIAALNHPNICQLYDVGADYLVMEFVEGEKAAGPMDPEAAVGLALQIARALEAAHSKKIIHRDLKPDNIMRTATGVKLLDFGLAKLAAEDAEPGQTAATATAEGTLAGTFAYMSPEQARGETVDERSDVFSLGAVLSELLSGERAFRGSNPGEILSAVLVEDPRVPSGPARVVEVIRKCLRKKREERFASMTDVSAALEAAARSPDEAAELPSIAVLPFADMSAERDQEYFSDGLAEEIINVLTRIQGLKVIARTSAFAFKGKQEDIRRIAEALGVATILEGSVRKAGNRLRITAQLVSARDGAHLWSNRYDREMEDIFAIQDEIAQAIADALEVRLTAETRPAQRHTPRLEAYEAVLRARHFMQQWTPESLARGKALYLEAIELDPGYALARCELGLNYFPMATEHLIPPPEAARLISTLAHEALAIDRQLGEARALLGLAAMLEYQWESAEGHFRQAFAAEAPHSMVSVVYGSFFLPALGRIQEAVAHLEGALRQDPLNPLLRQGLGFVWLSVDDPVGERIMERMIEVDPSAWIASAWLAPWYVRRGDLQKARLHAERAHALFPTHPGPTGTLAAVLALEGDQDRPAGLLEEMGTDGEGTPIGWYSYHVTRGEPALAARWLDKAIEQRDTRAPFILPGLCGRQFVSTAYWPPLRKKMNLPEASP